MKLDKAVAVQEAALNQWEKDFNLKEAKLDSEYTVTYNGPIFRFGQYVRDTGKTYTGRGVTEARAISNLIMSIKNNLGLPPRSDLTIDRNKIKIVNYTDFSFKKETLPKETKCDRCGAFLTDGGFCPNCDDGRDDLLNEIFSL